MLSPHSVQPFKGVLTPLVLAKLRPPSGGRFHLPSSPFRSSMLVVVPTSVRMQWHQADKEKPSCYTSYCTSDKYYSNYYGGVTACAQLGIGTAPTGAPAGAPAGATTTASSAGSPTATGHSAGTISRPPIGSGDIFLFTTFALFWIGGLGLMFL